MAEGQHRIRVGVAGWDYKDWHGIVYPESRPRDFDPLRYLAGYLDVIEINSSFYGPPKPKSAEAWVRRVDGLADFAFTAKLWRRFTHERKTAWTVAELEEARSGFAPLLDAGLLSAVLLQFPWSFKNDDAAREWVRDVVDAFDDHPLVIEVRHTSWNEPDFYGWLAERDIGFVNIDQPLFKRCIRPSARATGHVGYVRVHGRNYQDWFRKEAGRDERYNYLYPIEELMPWVERTEEIADDPATSETAVVFNNHYKGQAVVNAIEFKRLLGDEADVPDPLLDAYPRLASS